MSANGIHEEKRDRDCGVEKPGPVVLRSARLRLAFVECVSAEDLEDVVHGLVIAAREGSVSAARLLLKYVFDEKALAEAEKVAKSAGEWELPLTPDPSPPRGEGRSGGGLSDLGWGVGRSGDGLSDRGWGEGRSGGGLSDLGWGEGRSGVYEEDGDFPLTPDPSPPRGEGRIGGEHSEFGRGDGRNGGGNSEFGRGEEEYGDEESGKAIVVEERSGRGPSMHVDLERLYREAGEKLTKEMDGIPWDSCERMRDKEDCDPWTQTVSSEEPACEGLGEPAGDACGQALERGRAEEE